MVSESSVEQEPPSPRAAPAAEHGKTARDLQWRQLTASLASRCLSPAAVTRMEALEPAETLPAAQRQMRLTAEALACLFEADPIPRARIAPLEAVLEHLGRGGVATGEQLRDVARLLEAASTLRAYGAERKARLPRLAAALWSEPGLRRLAERLAVAIDDGGQVTDEASATLRDARRRVAHVRRALQDRLDALMTRFSDVLREQSPVERDGRYGLPVRADAHRKVEGIVLGASASGATLYVEPPGVTALANQLTLATGEVERELARVLAQLSAAVKGEVDDVRAAYEAGLEADRLGALCDHAQQTRSIAVHPDDSARLDLRAMRHPLLVLQGDEVVANDIVVEAGRALVISGPNAGGKTVALTCLGLAVWMARAGVPLPVLDGSSVGWFDTVLSDVGDGQSLERSLSTFSAHVSKLGRILRTAGRHTLVLLDEIAGGTDPEEGAALAAAVLEALVAQEAAVAVTTHYERLKQLATQQADSPFVNASVGFDFERMLPTFRLTLGVPGASSALAVAARFGVPEAVVDRARALLPKEALHREALLSDLEREKRIAEEERAALTIERAAAERLRRDLEAERKEVRSKEREKLTRAAADLTAAVRDARAKLRAVEQDVTPGGIRAAERMVDDAAHLVSIDGALAKATRPAAPSSARPPQLEVGSRVYVERLGSVAEVVEAPDRGHVRVRAGAFTLRVPVAELRADTRAPARVEASRPRAAKHPPQEVRKVEGQPELRTSDNTCNLRGMRVEEAIEQLDRFIDGRLQGSDPVGFVLHGHGTGALRRAVREHLALHSHVERARPAETREGGDAFTVFWVGG